MSKRNRVATQSGDTANKRPRIAEANNIQQSDYSSDIIPLLTNQEGVLNITKNIKNSFAKFDGAALQREYSLSEIPQVNFTRITTQHTPYTPKDIYDINFYQSQCFSIKESRVQYKRFQEFDPEYFLQKLPKTLNSRKSCKTIYHECELALRRTQTKCNPPAHIGIMNYFIDEVVPRVIEQYLYYKNSKKILEVVESSLKYLDEVKYILDQNPHLIKYIDYSLDNLNLIYCAGLQASYELSLDNKTRPDENIKYLKYTIEYGKKINLNALERKNDVQITLFHAHYDYIILNYINKTLLPGLTVNQGIKLFQEVIDYSKQIKLDELSNDAKHKLYCKLFFAFDYLAFHYLKESSTNLGNNFFHVVKLLISSIHCGEKIEMDMLSDVERQNITQKTKGIYKKLIEIKYNSPFFCIDFLPKNIDNPPEIIEFFQQTITTIVNIKPVIRISHEKLFHAKYDLACLYQTHSHFDSGYINKSKKYFKEALGHFLEIKNQVLNADNKDEIYTKLLNIFYHTKDALGDNVDLAYKILQGLNEDFCHQYSQDHLINNIDSIQHQISKLYKALFDSSEKENCDYIIVTDDHTKSGKTNPGFIDLAGQSNTSEADNSITEIVEIL